MGKKIVVGIGLILTTGLVIYCYRKVINSTAVFMDDSFRWG